LGKGGGGVIYSHSTGTENEAQNHFLLLMASSGPGAQTKDEHRDDRQTSGKPSAGQRRYQRAFAGRNLSSLVAIVNSIYSEDARLRPSLCPVTWCIVAVQNASARRVDASATFPAEPPPPTHKTEQHFETLRRDKIDLASNAVVRFPAATRLTKHHPTIGWLRCAPHACLPSRDSGPAEACNFAF
jgi:hypothetical protein